MENEDKTKDSTPSAVESTVIPSDVSRILSPSELSKQIYSELTFQTLPVRYKKIEENDLKNILKECNDTAKELVEKGHTDANLLYRISNGKQEYSGADEKTFLSIFAKSRRIDFISVSVSAKYDKNKGRFLLNLDVSLGSTKGYSNKIQVSGDDELWVKNTHARFSLLVADCNNANRFLYSLLTEFLFQISAVIIIFAVSVYSTKYSEQIKLPYSSVYIFAAIFLLGSNSWTYLSRTLLELRSRFFPVVTFKERRAESIVLWLAVAFAGIAVTWSLNTTFDFVKGKVTANEQTKTENIGNQPTR